jgi:hypothetical protein
MPARIKDMSVGYVYVLSNSAMGRLLKIGFTCGSVEKRARELSGATGVPGAFVVEYFHISEDVEEIEALVHAELNGLRYSDSREFFDASVTDAVAAIERLIKLPAASFKKQEPPEITDDPGLPCRRCGFPFIKSSAQQFCPKCDF